ADWGAAVPFADLDGDGKLQSVQAIINHNSKLGKILPSVPGMQMVTGEPLNYPEKEPPLGKVRFKTREHGQWAQKWETVVDLIWQCEPIFGDFDHCGRTEIALIPWYKLNLLDAETGAIKQTAE